MVNGRCHGAAVRCVKEMRSLLGLVPLLLGSMLVAALAMAAGPASTEHLFQSPISPVSPVGAETPAIPSPTVPQATAPAPTPTPTALRAVPTPPNLLPWLAGLAVVVVVVVLVLFWRSRRKREEDSL